MKTKSVAAKKYFGQNFLQSEDVVRDIAEAIPHEKPLVIIEAGPGLGMLTKELAKRADEVIAYEIDTSLKDKLEENLEEFSNIEIRYRDFLKVNLEEELPEEKDREYAFASNLPYYITTPILFKVLESGVPFTSVTVMVQKEVADRFLAKENSPDYNDLSVIASISVRSARCARSEGRISARCPTSIPRSSSLSSGRKNRLSGIKTRSLRLSKACSRSAARRS